jgi:hypothetical protein
MIPKPSVDEINGGVSKRRARVRSSLAGALLSARQAGTARQNLPPGISCHASPAP